MAGVLQDITHIQVTNFQSLIPTYNSNTSINPPDIALTHDVQVLRNYYIRRTLIILTGLESIYVYVYIYLSLIPITLSPPTSLTELTELMITNHKICRYHTSMCPTVSPIK
jgi:hypothetical protein